MTYCHTATLFLIVTSSPTTAPDLHERVVADVAVAADHGALHHVRVGPDVGALADLVGLDERGGMLDTSHDAVLRGARRSTGAPPRAIDSLMAASTLTTSAPTRPPLRSVFGVLERLDERLRLHLQRLLRAARAGP